MLGPQDPKFNGKKTLVLDLDETLVNSNVVEFEFEQNEEYRNSKKHQMN